MGNLIIASCWLLFFGVWAALSIAGGSGGQQRHDAIMRLPMQCRRRGRYYAK